MAFCSTCGVRLGGPAGPCTCRSLPPPLSAVRVEKSASSESTPFRTSNFLKPALFVFGICLLLGALSGFLEYRSGGLDRDVPRIVAEAAGRVPIAQPDNDGAKALRDFFREALTVRKEVAEMNRRYQTPEMAHLHQAQSMSSREQVVRTLQQLRGLQQFSLRMTELPRQMADHFQTSRSRLSGTRYAPFLERVQRGFEERAGETVKFRVKEQEYLQSEIDIYTFILQNFNSFSVHGPDIFIADRNVLESYNARLSRVQRIAREYTKLSNEEEAKQKLTMNSNHLSASDLDSL